MREGEIIDCWDQRGVMYALQVWDSSAYSLIFSSWWSPQSILFVMVYLSIYLSN